jgi:hypothetical protein
MAMATATTVVVVLMLVVMSTTAIVVFTTAIVVSTATVVVVATTSAAVTVTTTATCQVLHHVVYLFLGSFAVLQHSAFEIECLASQWVVEVHLHLLFANLQHATVEALALLVLQGYDGILIDVLVVEVSVDAEHIAIEVEDVFLVILAIALLLAQGELEVLTLLCGNHLLLELIECKTKTSEE